MLSIRRLIHQLFGNTGSSMSMPVGDVPPAKAQEVDWSSLRVGDQLIATDDVFLQTHRRGIWYAASYPNYRQFASGKTYSIVQVRRRTGVVFLFDEAGFRVALNEFQGRRFAIKRSVSAIHHKTAEGAVTNVNFIGGGGIGKTSIHLFFDPQYIFEEYQVMHRPPK